MLGLSWQHTRGSSPLGFWWLEVATIYALSLVLIASLYIGFAVADGRPSVIAVESTVAGIFVVIAAAGMDPAIDRPTEGDVSWPCSPRASGCRRPTGHSPAVRRR